MGLTAITSVAGSLLSKLESLHGSKAAKTNTASAAQISSAPDQSKVSDPGMLFSRLQTLSQQNPAEFKKIAAQVAQQLQAAGSSSTGSSQAGVLNQMASNFQHASQTGSFSDLFTHPSQTAPQQESTTAASGHAHHHYGHADGVSATATVNGIFSQALSQIQNDAGASALTV